MNHLFEVDTYLPSYDWKGSPWGENREIGYWLVNYFKPKCIVELGSYLGCSTFTFAQAVKDNSLDTRIVAIDTWKGDEFSGFYGEDTFKTFSDISRNLFSSLHIDIIRKEFDVACQEDFGQNQIDFLHIDGNHKYEDVKNDFNKWSEKLTNNAVVLFHDIGVERFGVKDFWRELTETYSTMEIHNTNGLGILYMGISKTDHDILTKQMKRDLK